MVTGYVVDNRKVCVHSRKASKQKKKNKKYTETKKNRKKENATDFSVNEMWISWIFSLQLQHSPFFRIFAWCISHFAPANTKTNWKIERNCHIQNENMDFLMLKFARIVSCRIHMIFHWDRANRFDRRAFLQANFKNAFSIFRPMINSIMLILLMRSNETCILYVSRGRLGERARELGSAGLALAYMDMACCREAISKIK